MTLGGPKRFLLKNREKKFHISGVARKLENVSIMEHYYGFPGFCSRVFFTFFCNLTRNLITLGIVIYRLTLVLGSSFLFSSKQIKVLGYIILVAILLTSLNLTGWAVYYREDFRPFLGEVKIDNLGSRTSQFPLTYWLFLVCSRRSQEFYYNMSDFYQNKTIGNPQNNQQLSLPKTNPFHIATIISFLSGMVVTPVGYSIMYW